MVPEGTATSRRANILFRGIYFGFRDARLRPSAFAICFDFLWVVFGHAMIFLCYCRAIEKRPLGKRALAKSYDFLPAFLTLRGFADDFFAGLEGARSAAAAATVARILRSLAWLALLSALLAGDFLFGGCG